MNYRYKIPSLSTLLSGFKLGSDTLFLLLAVVIVIVWGFALGKTRVIASLLSIYVSFGLLKIFPYFSSVSGLPENFTPWLQTVFFFLIYVVTFLIFNYSVIRKRFSSDEYSILGVMVLSLIQIGMLLSILITVIPIDILKHNLGGFYQWFADPQFLFAWMVAPLPAMLLLNIFNR